MRRLNNILIGLIIVNVIILILISISGCSMTNKPIAAPTQKYNFVKVVTLDNDGNSKIQFVKQIK